MKDNSCCFRTKGASTKDDLGRKVLTVRRLSLRITSGCGVNLSVDLLGKLAFSVSNFCSGHSGVLVSKDKLVSSTVKIAVPRVGTKGIRAGKARLSAV